MAYFKVEAVVESDRSDVSLGLFLQGLLMRADFTLEDLSVYEVVHVPTA